MQTSGLYTLDGRNYGESWMRVRNSRGTATCSAGCLDAVFPARIWGRTPAESPALGYRVSRPSFGGMGEKGNKAGRPVLMAGRRVTLESQS